MRELLREGTQGVKGSRDRAVIPADLCKELAEYAALRLREPHIDVPRIYEQRNLFT